MCAWYAASAHVNPSLPIAPTLVAVACETRLLAAYEGRPAGHQTTSQYGVAGRTAPSPGGDPGSVERKGIGT